MNLRAFFILLICLEKRVGRLVCCLRVPEALARCLVTTHTPQSGSCSADATTFTTDTRPPSAMGGGVARVDDEDDSRRLLIVVVAAGAGAAAMGGTRGEGVVVVWCWGKGTTRDGDDEDEEDEEEEEEEAVVGRACEEDVGEVVAGQAGGSPAVDTAG